MREREEKKVPRREETSKCALLSSKGWEEKEREESSGEVKEESV